MRRGRRPHFVIGDTPAKLLCAGPVSPDPIVQPSGPGIRWQMPITPTAALVVIPDCDERPEHVVRCDGPDPQLSPEWHAVLPDVLREDAGLFHGVVSWLTSERWIWARERDDLEIVGRGFTDRDRQMSATELHQTNGFIRPRDPHHIRMILGEARSRMATRAAADDEP